MASEAIYRDFHITMTQKKCVAFLHAVALVNATITCSFVISNAFPPETVNRWTMFFKLRFRNQEQVDKFDKLVRNEIGYVTQEPERVSPISPTVPMKYRNYEVSNSTAPICIDCGISVEDTPLYRTAALGETPAKWKCKPCAERSIVLDTETVIISETINSYNNS